MTSYGSRFVALADRLTQACHDARVLAGAAHRINDPSTTRLAQIEVDLRDLIAEGGEV